MSACSRKRFPGPKLSRGTARTDQVRPRTRSSDHQASHKRVWRLLSMDISGRHAVQWPFLDNVCPVYGTPFPRHQNSKVVSLSWYLPGTCHTGVSAALGARVCSQTPAGVHRAFQNASTDHRIQHLIGAQPWESRSGLRLLVRGSTSQSRGVWRYRALRIPSGTRCV
jgi:hypothetical protein